MNRMLGTIRNDHLIWLIAQTIIALVSIADCLFDFESTRCRGVMCLAGIHGVFCRLADMSGCGEVWLSQGELIHFDAGTFQFLGFCCSGNGRGWLEFLNSS